MKTLLLLSILLSSIWGWSQDVIQVNRENKTIAVSADDEAAVAAEVAVLVVGFRNYAVTKQAAFEENLKVSNDIVQALLKAHVDPKNMQTESLSISRVDPDEHWSESMKNERQFSAAQSWRVRVPADKALGKVDLAIRSGAIEVSTPEWDFFDPSDLQVTAVAAALSMARTIA